MPSPAKFLTRRVGGKAVPWLTVLEVARTIYRRGRRGWSELNRAEQAELRRILGDARHGASAVGPQDRRRLRQLVLKALRKAATPL